jgi:hypothetical protein
MLYGDEFIFDLAHDFGIAAAQIEPLKRFLNHAAELYGPSKKIVSRAKQQSQLRQELECVAAAQRRLEKVLSELSALARERIWLPAWENPNLPPDLVGLLDPFGSHEYTDEVQFRQVFGAFGTRIQTRLKGMADVRDKGGRPERTELRVWVSFAQRFWEQVLERPFTYNTAKGVPKSAAFLFCAHAIKPLDPHVTERALSTAMRGAVKPIKVKVSWNGRAVHERASQKPRPKKRKVSASRIR